MTETSRGRDRDKQEDKQGLGHTSRDTRGAMTETSRVRDRDSKETSRGHYRDKQGP